MIISILTIGAVILSLSATTSAVQVSIRDTTGAAGDTVDVRIATSDLTGKSIYSYQFNLTYDDSRLSLLDLVDTGTITEPWGNVVYRLEEGSVTAAAAGSQPLGGGGELLFLRFRFGPGTGGSWVQFTDFDFNEGSPADTTDDGYIHVYPAPTIDVIPDSGQVAVGDSIFFFVGGGTPPYTWGTTDTSVAAVLSSGWLHGKSLGTCRVLVADNEGIRDTTSGGVRVRAMKLWVPDDLRAAPEDTFDIPVNVTDVTGLGIRSLQFSISFTSQVFTVLDVITTGTLTQTWESVEKHIRTNSVSVAAAGVDAIAGSGPVILLRCYVPLGSSGSSNLDLTYGLFDETYVPALDDGHLTINLPPSIYVSPNTAHLLVGETRSFAVGGSPTPPYSWGSTDPAVGAIDAEGIFSALGGGVCSVYVEDAASARDTSDAIRVYDLLVYAPAIDSVGLGDPPIAIPIYLDRDAAGLAIWSYELSLGFNKQYVHAISVTDSGSLTDPWGIPAFAVHEDSISIAGAGGTLLVGTGPLVHVYLQADSAAYVGSTSALYINNAFFNEGSPVADMQGGTIVITGACARVIGAGEDRAHCLIKDASPNPFNGEIAIHFVLPKPAFAVLTVHDVSGRVVATIEKGHRNAGEAVAVWRGREQTGGRAAPGIYFVRLTTGADTDIRKIVFLE